VVVAGAALVALIARAAWFEPRRLVVIEQDLRLPGWPSGLDGMRIALVSDLHGGGPQVGQQAIRRVVERVNATAPDLVALLGDAIDYTVIGGSVLAPEAVSRELGALRAPLGAIAVLGNHDWANDGPGVLRALREAGATVLENQTTELEFRGTRFCVAGLADATTRRPDMYATLRDVPPDQPLLLLSHNPDTFPQAPSRVSLTVSGHTHGGQVALPLLGPVETFSRVSRRVGAGGLHRVAGNSIYVSTGVGLVRQQAPQVRFLTRPSVGVVTLR
jgi:predicted MPP superfamily phosphohydrolase